MVFIWLDININENYKLDSVGKDWGYIQRIKNRDITFLYLAKKRPF